MNTCAKIIHSQEKDVQRRITRNASQRVPTSLEQDGSGCRVKINVSGERFSAKLHTLQKYPNTLLGSQLLLLFYDQRKDEYFFDRDPDLFRFILNFYRLGKLHVSDVECLEAFRDEMDYFGIPHSAVDDCCWNIFKKIRNPSYEIGIPKNDLDGSNKDTKELGRTEQTSNPETIGHSISCPKKSSKQNPYNETSKIVYSGSGTKKKDTTKRTLVPLKKTFIQSQIKDGKSICRTLIVQDVLQYFYGLLILASAACNAIETVDCRTKTKCGDYYAQVFFAMETFFAAVFTADYVIRFLLAKRKCVFLRELLNIVDLIAILPYYFELVFKFLIGASDIMITFRILRVVRLMKLNRNSPRLQAFLLTLRNCASDLLFLYFMFAFGILLFGGVIYYAERNSSNAGNFTSIAHSLWFTCVTMVTTGYGDVIPVTVMGKIFAALCGFCGVLVMSLPIPIMQDKRATIDTQY
ncbi:potassium voltage-gated channel protein Shal-like [Actinia tenebrosa]|uniref:Potassium voltage-gated channel protein Shal-like n=1 Tax=Actinia tenebrosa TaxID=6105 RepID=A0A6P8HZ62_ACTTE|nr:potassium voltage-gated channel protein Shal-like [Actinia tenebrosa]